MPDTQKAEIIVQGQPGQKVTELHVHKQARCGGVHL
jgi:hypothetical protein